MKIVKSHLIAFTLILLSISGVSSCTEHYSTKINLNAEYMAFISNARTKSEIFAFRRLLVKNNLANLVDIKQLLRQGTDWKKIREPAYALPPRKFWPRILRTLTVLKKEIIPVLGEIEVLSGFRTTRYNRRAKGTRSSKHLVFAALDIKPKDKITRRELHKRLLEIWRTKGRRYQLGLGLYSGTRFHIDTARYRKW
ncbi:hypothetical protein MNBD_GAMMA12-2420 [hydrothermal vent metagenome]|uniref:Peptidase M15A C-terminal domain-containing protein n=1 Tax=hydrothermal vent metagenome TaxID=652676 RepID=A0A3B0ZJJ1_9ZZZZ